MESQAGREDLACARSKSGRSLNPLEIRLIAYGLLAITLMGGSAYAAHRLTAMHYQALMASDRAAQQDTLAKAQQDVIAAQAAQTEATQRAEKDHEALVTADTQSRNAILGSVRNLETALHLSAVPATVADPSKFGGAAPGAASPDEIANLVDRLNGSIAAATAACQHDSAELAGILELASHR